MGHLPHASRCEVWGLLGVQEEAGERDGMADGFFIWDRQERAIRSKTSFCHLAWNVCMSRKHDSRPPPLIGGFPPLQLLPTSSRPGEVILLAL